MSEKPRIALLNDSFPPTIDGVANVVVNYASILQERYADVVVATPWYPEAEDHYNFPVLRYPSINMTEDFGYRAGSPFSPDLIRRIEDFQPDIIHTHCPIVSCVLARMLRDRTGAPVVFTYHTKFDIDIKKALKGKLIQEASIKALVANISACDDVWVVSEGAGKNLTGLGYTGSYTVMENGVDFPKGRADADKVCAFYRQYGIEPDTTVFLFVGRMMWYKGIRLSLDGLKAARDQGAKFKFVAVGDGMDAAEIKKYAEDIGIMEDCVFTGAIRDREMLRVVFSAADLFLFPSTFDTNGIVVREAAACYCPSLLIDESCAAEGITDGRTGFLIPEDAGEMCRRILWACAHREELRAIGERAANEIYLSWDDAVERAYRRYELLLRRYGGMKSPALTDRNKNFLSVTAATLSALGTFRESLSSLKNSADDAEERFRGKKA